MCSFGSSNSAPTTQFSTQTTTAAPQAQAMYNQAWQNAQKTAQRPFQPYSYDPNAFVAPMNQTQMQAVGNIGSYQGASDPFFQMGANMVGQAGNTTAPQVLSQYTNPYMGQVVDPVRAAVQQQQAFQNQQLIGDQVKAGAFGQERGQLMRAVQAGQQNLGLGQALSPLYQDAYKTGLGAAQADLNRQMQAGQTMGQLGQGYTQTGLGAAQALLGAGTVGQQTQQAGLQALYNQYLMQQQYPYQQAQFLSSIAAGLGPGFGGTTSGFQSSMQPLSSMGMPLSDPAAKVGPDGEKPEVIGQTNDGQDIYRYRVVDPDTGKAGPVQIGLMADEVERRRPDAIGEYGNTGLRTVDYEKATEGAARMGGGVKPEGGDYADGGGVDDIVNSHRNMYAALAQMGARGIIPETKMVTANLTPAQLSYMTPQQKQQYTIGNALKDAVQVYSLGKGVKGEYDEWFKPKVGAPMQLTGAVNAASGGSITGYDDDQGDVEMRQGPKETNMPTAKLETPSLSYAKPQKQDEGGGLDDILKIGKTIFDIGSKAYMLSDPRAKTGVRPAHADGGSVLDNFIDAISGRGYIDGSSWEDAPVEVGAPMDILPHHAARAAGLRPATRPAAVPAARHGVMPRPAREIDFDQSGNRSLGAGILPTSHFTDFPEREISLGSGILPSSHFEPYRRGEYRHGGPANDDDIDYVARTLVKEAGGEGERGMRAVADVIRNRLHSGKYGETAKDVVLAPNQFEPWGEKMRGTRADPRLIDPASSIYRQARGLASEELAGDSDITGGAMNFYNPKLVNPNWARGKAGLNIGNHTFLDASGAAGAGLKPAAYTASNDRPSNAGLDAIDSATSGKGVVPAAGGDETPARGLTGFFRGTPARDMGEKAGDFLTSERFIVPLLTGLGTMASSQSRYLAPAILQGIGAGAASYMEVPKIQAETERTRQEALNKEALTPKMKAETRAIELENYMKSFLESKYGNLVFLKDGTPISRSDYMEMIRRGEKPELLGGIPQGGLDMVKKGVETAGGGEGAQLPASGAPTVDKAAPQSTPGGVYDEGSSKSAREEAKLAVDGGLKAEAAAKNTETYRNYVTSEATSARETAPYLKELSTTLADAYASKGWNTAGFQSGLRSEISSLINTIYRSAGGTEDLSELKSNEDKVNKVAQFLAERRGTAAGQHAYAALSAIKAAVPNLDMSPEAGAELTAQLMALQQKSLDRETHFNRYINEGNGFAGKAGPDFDSPQRSSRYQKEQQILKDMMLHRPGALKMMMSGANVTKEQIEEKIRKWYGKKAPPDMWRYFAPAQ